MIRIFWKSAVALLPLLFATSLVAAIPIHFHAPAEFAPLAARLQSIDPRTIDRLARFVGADPANMQPIQVTLAPDATQSLAPGWAAGYALPDAGVIVLYPRRNPTYPDRSIDETYLHELTHVLIHRAAGEIRIPRWFHEGVATVAAKSWSFEQEARFSAAVVLKQPRTLEAVNSLFYSDASAAAAGYAVSEAFARDLWRRYDSDVFANVLRRCARGERFDVAFFEATRLHPDAAYGEFWSRRGLRDQIITALTSSALLWALVVAIALAAFRRKKVTTTETTRRWEEEEAEAYEPDDPDGGESDETLDEQPYRVN